MTLCEYFLNEYTVCMYCLRLREVLSHYDLIIKLPAVSVSSTNVFPPIATLLHVSVSVNCQQR